MPGSRFYHLSVSSVDSTKSYSDAFTFSTCSGLYGSELQPSIERLVEAQGLKDASGFKALPLHLPGKQYGSEKDIFRTLRCTGLAYLTGSATRFIDQYLEEVDPKASLVTYLLHKYNRPLRLVQGKRRRVCNGAPGLVVGSASNRSFLLPDTE